MEIPLDESTDITNFDQLLVDVRYSYKGNIGKGCLFCQPLDVQLVIIYMFTLTIF